MGKPTPCIAGGGHLAAIAAVLQLVGSAIRFGPFSVSLVLIPHCAGHRPVRLRHGLLAGAGIRGRGASAGGCRPLSGGRSGRGHCDGTEQGHCLRRSGGLVRPVAAPTVSETFHSAVRLWPPRWSIRGWFCWAVPAHWRSPVAWAASWRPCAAGRPSTTRICCCVACGSSTPLTAHRQISPEKRSRYKRRLGTTSPQPPFFCPTTGRAGLTERTPALPMRRR